MTRAHIIACPAPGSLRVSIVPASIRHTVSLEKYKCVLFQHDETLLVLTCHRLRYRTSGLLQVTAHSAALPEVRTFRFGRSFRLYDIDIGKYCFKFIAAAFWTSDALVFPVAHGCHYVENFAASALQVVKRQYVHLRCRNDTNLQFTTLRRS